MMISKDSIWNELEKEARAENTINNRVMRLVLPNMLLRVYAAVEVNTFKRMLMLEIPEEDKNKIDDFKEPLGLNVRVEKSGVEKCGNITCILESGAESKNDIFSIVSDDVVMAIENIQAYDDYTDSMCSRLNKWKEFFKNRENMILLSEKARGLFGELYFMKKVISTTSYKNITAFWHGPLAAAQDFQSDKIAVEIKTTKVASPRAVTISSLAQLDIENREKLYLTLIKVEENKENGQTLPSIIAEISDFLDEANKTELEAKLLCIGYNDIFRDKYTQKYIIRKEIYYDVHSDFPRMTVAGVEKGIIDCKYSIDLSHCEQYEVDFSSIMKKWTEG